MTASEIIKDLKSRKFKPLYLLHGDEDYFIDEVSDYMESHVLPDAEKGFNQTVLYGKDTDIMSVLNAARRYPMMAEYQLIIIKEAQAMTWPKEDPDKKGINPVLSYFENPLATTILVFCYKHGKFDKRKKAFKIIEKNGLVFESAPLSDSKIPLWAESFIKSKGYRIGQQAAAMLAEYLGNDLSKIANELGKLMLNIPPGNEIGLKDIEDNIGISKEYNVFELQTALVRRDVLKANQIINYFEANPKTNPIVLVMGSLNNFFSKVLLYHYAKDKGNPAKDMGISPYQLNNYEQAARNYNYSKAVYIISLLREYDLKSKGLDSSASHGELLKEMVFKIMH